MLNLLQVAAAPPRHGIAGGDRHGISAAAARKQLTDCTLPACIPWHALLLILFALLAPCRAAGVEIPAAGGTLIPISAPGPNYANDGQHPWPCMVYLPNGYSPSGAPYPLVFCLHGDGEVGDGSSDGTLTASSTNQLAYVFNSGPLVLVKSGSSFFGDNHVIVVSPQSDIGNGAGFDGESSNVNRVDLTMRYLLATYHIDPSRIYTMGLSCGAGALVRYAYASANSPAYQLAAIIPIANIQGLGSTYTDFSRFTGSITWFIGDCDDTIAYIRLTTGRTWNGYGDGWAGGISRCLDQASSSGPLPADTIKDRCLTTHPDYATAITAGGFNAGSGNIGASTVSGTYPGSYSSSNPAGWTWVPDETFMAGSRLQVTIRQGGGHAGWAQTFGTTTPNLPFWNWLLAQRLGQTPTGYSGAPAAVSIALTPGSRTLCVGQSQQFQANVLTATGTGVIGCRTASDQLELQRRWQHHRFGPVHGALRDRHGGGDRGGLRLRRRAEADRAGQPHHPEHRDHPRRDQPGRLADPWLLGVALLIDQDGRAALPNQPAFSWSASSGGTITSGGLFTATAISGSATVQAAATINGVPTAGNSTVALASPLFVISPARIAIPHAGRQQFTATVETGSGVPLVPQPAITWTLKGSGGTLSSTGTFTESATASGTLQVVATAHLASRAFIAEATVQLGTTSIVSSVGSGGTTAAESAASPTGSQDGGSVAPAGAVGLIGRQRGLRPRLRRRRTALPAVLLAAAAALRRRVRHASPGSRAPEPASARG